MLVCFHARYTPDFTLSARLQSSLSLRPVTSVARIGCLPISSWRQSDGHCHHLIETTWLTDMPRPIADHKINRIDELLPCNYLFGECPSGRLPGRSNPALITGQLLFKLVFRMKSPGWCALSDVRDVITLWSNLQRA